MSPATYQDAIGEAAIETDNDNPTEATREEMSAAKLPLAYRDGCAHLLIPLNRCRVDEYYIPWKCEVRRNLICYKQLPKTDQPTG